jgi:putative chitinase
MNTEKLKPLLPAAIFAELETVIVKFSINTPQRLAHFLAQCAHESGGFMRFSENLNYSAAGLKTTFSKYFKTDSDAEAYARKPEKIANRVYASRMGNGDEASGDGWRFRGRGAIQLTGKNNYKAFDAFVSEDITSNPDLVATKYPLLSAAWFWDTNKLNRLADVGALEQHVADVTKKVNGGSHGLKDRIEKFNKFYSALR